MARGRAFSFRAHFLSEMMTDRFNIEFSYFYVCANSRLKGSFFRSLTVCSVLIRFLTFKLDVVL